MPRRKGSPLDEAVQKLVLHRGNVLDALDDALRALESARPPHNADEEALERWAATQVEQLDDARIGKKQRIAGTNSLGRRGQFKVAPERLLGEVQAMHTRSPRLTFNDVCTRVATENQLKSAWSVKKAAAASKWPDPRRTNK